jgi:hypothetical protein
MGKTWKYFLYSQEQDRYVIQYGVWNLSHNNKAREINRRDTKRKEVNLSLSTDDKNLCRPKDSTRKLLDLINTFGKIVAYKIIMQKSVAFPYTNNRLRIN